MNRRAFMRSLSGALAGLALFRFTGAQGVVDLFVGHPRLVSYRFDGLDQWGTPVSNVITFRPLDPAIIAQMGADLDDAADAFGH